MTRTCHGRIGWAAHDCRVWLAVRLGAEPRLRQGPFVLLAAACIAPWLVLLWLALR